MIKIACKTFNKTLFSAVLSIAVYSPGHLLADSYSVEEEIGLLKAAEKYSGHPLAEYMTLEGAFGLSTVILTNVSKSCIEEPAFQDDNCRKARSILKKGFRQSYPNLADSHFDDPHFYELVFKLDKFMDEKWDFLWSGYKKHRKGNRKRSSALREEALLTKQVRSSLYKKITKEFRVNG